MLPIYLSFALFFYKSCSCISFSENSFSNLTCRVTWNVSKYNISWSLISLSLIHIYLPRFTRLRVRKVSSSVDQHIILRRHLTSRCLRYYSVLQCFLHMHLVSTCLLHTTFRQHLQFSHSTMLTLHHG